MSNVKKFSVVSEGYDISEVNKFLKIVTDEFEKLVGKNSELESLVNELNLQIEELEAKSSSVDFYKEEIDSYLESKHETKKSLEIELEILEDKVKAYQESLNTMFYDHIEMINKLK